MRRGLLVTLALLSGVAFAEEAPPESAVPPEDPAAEDAFWADAPGETIYVDDQAVIRAREEVGLVLRDLGYHEKRTRDGRQIFVSEVPWKPMVVLDDDGWMRTRRAPVSFSRPDLDGIWDSPLGYLVCVAAPTTCIHVGGLVVSRRKLAHAEEAVVEGIRPALRRYEEAVVLRSMNRRVGEEVPLALDALWEQGIPLEGEGTLETWVERRQALLQFWVDRTDTEWGDQVREVVASFMEHVVQESPHPFTADEVAWANARAPEGRVLRLTLPGGE